MQTSSFRAASAFVLPLALTTTSCSGSTGATVALDASVPSTDADSATSEPSAGDAGSSSEQPSDAGDAPVGSAADAAPVFSEGGVPIADGGGLNPAVPPSSNFDLSTWELDLPTTPTSTETSAALLAGFTDPYFFTGTDGAMVMWCPLTGGLTANAHYPRSELREVQNGSAAAWSVAAGTAALAATVAVNEVPPNGTVIVGQIHEGGTGIYPLVKLLFEAPNGVGTVVANVQLAAASASGQNHAIVSGIPLNQLFSYRILLQPDGTLSVSVDDTTMTVAIDPSFMGSQLYFKAGSYPQQEEEAGADGSRVSVYSLAVSHT
jgi:hypothetical protein